MIRLVQTVCAAAVIAAAVPGYGQSLGDVARQEEARRASVQRAVKTLSNADLDPSAIVPPAGAAQAVSPCYMSKSKGQCVSAEEMVSTNNAGVLTKQNAPLEPVWRRDATSIRTRVESWQSQVAKLESVAADEGLPPSDRKLAEKQLVIARQALDSYERQWEKLEQAAANQHIPRVWIQPIPTLTTKTPQ